MPTVGTTTAGARPVASRLRSAVPPIVVLALAAGYFGADLVEGLDDAAGGAVPASAAAAIVALQALALVFRRGAPVPVFALVVALDAVLLGTSAGELGTGALAAMFATYALTRSGELRIRYIVVGCGGATTLVVSAVAMAVGGAFPPLAIAAVAVVRPALQYAAPAALAEFLLARERLVQALRDRAELAERERLRDVEREIAGVRTAMARELHDIAAHHLSGIIVGAQAASALVATDPDRTREMLRTVQQDARTTLADLRRTVGLLRSDDDAGAAPGRPAPVPSLDRVAALVQTAAGRGQAVALEVDGEPRVLGPLAETAGYRMVQESLANAADHAPGAPSRVRIEYLPQLVRITVHNDASAARPVPRQGGYGIAGMRERADLVGARLTTGRLPDGSWRNTLEIPHDPRRSAS
jgi:signal transduction histidine kinase